MGKKKSRYTKFGKCPQKGEIKSATAALWDTRLILLRGVENVTLGRWYCHYILKRSRGFIYGSSERQVWKYHFQKLNPFLLLTCRIYQVFYLTYTDSYAQIIPIAMNRNLLGCHQFPTIHLLPLQSCKATQSTENQSALHKPLPPISLTSPFSIPNSFSWQRKEETFQVTKNIYKTRMWQEVKTWICLKLKHWAERGQWGHEKWFSWLWS